eukprot:5040377-Prymnesium_polylepis.1
MLHSGALTASQAADIHVAASGGSGCVGVPRLLTLGSPGSGGGNIGGGATAVGFAYGLLARDDTAAFLLHYYAMSAHGYTRGTWASPEASDITDRDAPPAPYAAAGVVLAPLYLKWALAFEDVASRCVWLGKAVPYEWLAPGATPLVARRLPTRYGRVDLRMSARRDAPPTTSAMERRDAAESATARGSARLVVDASVTLLEPFVPPEGGLRLRLRVSPSRAGPLRSVLLGGQSWSSFDAAAQTVDFTARDLADGSLRQAMASIVATFGAE